MYSFERQKNKKEVLNKKELEFSNKSGFRVKGNKVKKINEEIETVAIGKDLSNVLKESYLVKWMGFGDWVGFINESNEIPKSGYFLGHDECKGTIGYFSSDGDVLFDGEWMEGNRKFGAEETVGIEIDLENLPYSGRFFVDGKEQKIIVNGIKKKVRFGVSFGKDDCEIEILELKKIDKKTLKGVSEYKTLNI